MAETDKNLEEGALMLLSTLQMVRNAGENLRPSFEEPLCWLYLMEKRGLVRELPSDWRSDLQVEEWLNDFQEFNDGID